MRGKGEQTGGGERGVRNGREKNAFRERGRERGAEGQERLEFSGKRPILNGREEMIQTEHANQK